MATRSIKININGKEIENSIAGISKELKTLRREYRHAEIGSKEYNEAAKGIKEATALMEKHTLAKRGLITATQSLVGVMGGLFATQAIIGFFGSAKDAAVEFEHALSSLSSITGATGADLEFYAEQAREIGKNVEGGAVAAVEAFKLIGSARPELLKNKEALAAVTKEAITLAQAGEIDIPAAAAALTGALNQFQLPAEEASRVINAIAAGSKEGASNIPEVTESINKFGVAAAASNISLEESVGLVELLGEYSIKGAEAGTGLRNVLSIMSSVDALPEKALQQLRDYGVNTDIVSDKTLSFEDRLREFSKIGGDATALTQVFGRENAIVGQIVLQNVDKFAAFTKAVTGTTVAVDQAKTNTDDYAGDVLKLGNAFDDTLIDVGNFIKDGMRPLVQTATAALMVLQEMPRFLIENRQYIYGLAAAVALWNGQLIAANISSLALAVAEKTRLIWTKAATVAQWNLNAAFAANPIGFVLKLLGLLALAFGFAYDNSQTLRAGLNGLWESVKEVGTIIVETFKQFAGGFGKLTKGDILGGLKDIGGAIIKGNPIGLAITEGKRLGAAYSRGYKEKIAQEAEKNKGEVGAFFDGAPTAKSANGIPDDAVETIPGTGTADQKKAARDKEAEEVKQHLKELRDAYTKAKDDNRMRRLQGEEKIIGDIERRYAKELATAKALEAKGVAEATEIRIELEKLKEDEVAEALAKYREEKKKEADEEKKRLEEDIFKATASEIEQRFEELDTFYGQLLERAEKSGMDTTAITDKWREEQLRLSREYNAKELAGQAQANVARMKGYETLFFGLSDALGGAMKLMAGEEGRFLEFQKLASLAQIAFDTGSAISSMIAAASSTSITPIDLAIKIATGLGVIFANIAQATSVVKGGEVPQYFAGGYHDVTGQTDGRAYRAQYIGRPMTGMLPSRPVLLASERGPEYFVSNRALRKPAVAYHVRMIDNIEKNKVRQFATGGSTEPLPGNAGGASSDPELKAILQMVAKYLSIPPTAIIPDRTVIDIDKRRRDISSASGGYYSSAAT